VDPGAAAAGPGGGVLIIRTLTLLGLAGALAVGWGCTAAPIDPPSVTHADAFDTRLDRLRIVGLNLHPVVALPGEPVAIQALAIGPDPLSTLGWRVDAAGLDLDRPLAGDALDAFRVPDLVTQVADGVPAVLTVPEWTDDGFERCSDPSQWPDLTDSGLLPEIAPTECFAGVPLRLTAQTPDGGRALAFATQAVQIGPDLDRPRRRIDPELATLVAPEEAEPGQTLALSFEGDIQDDRISSLDLSWVRWYADEGTFLRTGRTGVALLDDGFDWRIGADNVLRLPADTPPGPLRIVAVGVIPRARPFSGIYAGSSMVWAQVTVEVR